MRSVPVPVPDELGPGQESVWDYPRPPALRASTEQIEVVFGGVTICRTDRAWQVLETSHPPTYYLPRNSFLDGVLRPAPGHSFCEWKGLADYLDVNGGSPERPQLSERCAWYYPAPNAPFAALVDHVALYPERMDRCSVDGEPVRPQPGGFYGGWVTSKVAGPFKGGPGSMGW